MILIKLEPDEFKDKKVFTRFYVSKIDYKNKDISFIEIVDGNGNIRFSWGERQPRGNEIKPETFDLKDFEIRITSSDLAEDIKKKDARWSWEIFPGNTRGIRRKTKEERILAWHTNLTGLNIPSVTTITGILDKPALLGLGEQLRCSITSKRILDAIKTLSMYIGEESWKKQEKLMHKSEMMQASWDKVIKRSSYIMGRDILSA